MEDTWSAVHNTGCNFTAVLGPQNKGKHRNFVRETARLKRCQLTQLPWSHWVCDVYLSKVMF